jgi:hypothetical protein
MLSALARRNDKARAANQIPAIMPAMSEAARGSDETVIAAGTQSSFASGSLVNSIATAILVTGSFALYWTSSYSLEARGATTYFGADSWHFTELAFGHFNDRIMRLHPVTVGLALGWMKIFSPLAYWLAPIAILKAMFALVGALGVWAAVHAFSAFMPRRHAILWGAVYACSMGIWYFSSIEESKIISATLAAVYIALYVHLRGSWTPRGALLLTAVLFAACINEITAAFLVAIPAVDTFLKSRLEWRSLRWILLHALAAPLALILLEAIKRFAVTIAPNAEGNNFLEIFLFYASQTNYDLPTISAFLQRWVFFNLAAPEPEVHFADLATKYGGDFEPALLHYFGSPASAALVAIFAIMIAAAFLLRNRDPQRVTLTAIMLGLLAYALARLVFFFVFLPAECLLYSPSVSLAHLLLVAVPFAASRFPYKEWLTAALAAAMIATNGIFIFTAETASYVTQ